MPWPISRGHVSPLSAATRILRVPFVVERRNVLLLFLGINIREVCPGHALFPLLIPDFKLQSISIFKAESEIQN
jgi:hypothetical protein